MFKCRVLSLKVIVARYLLDHDETLMSVVVVQWAERFLSLSLALVITSMIG